MSQVAPSAAVNGAASIRKPAAVTPAHLHSWLHSPPYYTALSMLFFAVFFIQPHDWRVRVWTVLRGQIEDERVFLLVAAVCVHTFVFVTANSVMALIYYLELPFFEQFKIQPKPWPWKRGPEERAQYFSLIKKSLALIAFNQYVLAPVMVWFSYGDQKKFGMNGDISKVPHWYVSMFQIAIAMVVEDTLFYWAHRTLHHPKIYGYVHKVHHSYKTSIGLASEYAHPIEFIFSNAIPFTVGPLLCGMHYWTFFMWSLLRIGETVDGHSGYEFPWSPYRLLPFSGSSTAHDYHHSHNVGNYASFFSYWDRWMGTDVAFLKHEEKLAQQQLEGSTKQTASTQASNGEPPSPNEASPSPVPAEHTTAAEEESVAAPAASGPTRRSSNKKSKRAD